MRAFVRLLSFSKVRVSRQALITGLSEDSAFSSGQACFGSSFQDDVLDVVLIAESTFFGFVTVFVDRVSIRFNSSDFRLGIHPTVASGN